MQAGETITAESIEEAGTFPVYGGNGLRGFTEAKTHSGTRILIGRQGALCGNVHLVDGEFWASEHAIVAEPAVGVDSRWLAHLLRTMNLGQYSQAVAQPGIGTAQINALEIPLPSIDEQLAIGDYLDRETARIDTLIGEQQRLVEMLRERRLAVVRSTVPDPRSDTVHADKLGRRTRIGNGSTPFRDNVAFWTDGHIPWLNSAVVNQDRVVAATQFVTDDAVAKCHLPLVPPGSILVALTGQGKTRGAATILDIQATINQHMAYVTPDRSFWNSDYLYWALTAAYAELRALSDENGSTKGALTCEELKRFPIAHPPLDQQRRIAEYLDEQTEKIDTLIAETERFIELSRERRSALITAAVTGQIDVRDEVA